MQVAGRDQLAATALVLAQTNDQAHENAIVTQGKGNFNLRCVTLPEEVRDVKSGIRLGGTP